MILFRNINDNVDISNVVESYIIPTDVRSLRYNVRLNPVHVLEKNGLLKITQIL